jgi:hypothetical protein
MPEQPRTAEHKVTLTPRRTPASPPPPPPGSKSWALDHDIHVFAQTESRPGPLTDEGERWMECRQTGKVMVLCRCGYISGLIDRIELEHTVAGLAAEHSNDHTNAQVNEAAASTGRPGF